MFQINFSTLNEQTTVLLHDNPQSTTGKTSGRLMHHVSQHPMSNQQRRSNEVHQNVQQISSKPGGIGRGIGTAPTLLSYEAVDAAVSDAGTPLTDLPLASPTLS